jgi:hypothetical protein
MGVRPLGAAYKMLGFFSIGKLTKKFEGVQLSSDCKHDYPLLFAAISVSSERLVYQMVPAVSDRAVEQTVTLHAGLDFIYPNGQKLTLTVDMCICMYMKRWVYNICRGIDSDPVISRQITQSVGCSKNFLGKEILNTREKVSLD